MKIDAMRAQLSKIERQRQLLERQIQSMQEKRLAGLPELVGLDSIDGLILALIPHASSALRMKLHGAELDGLSTESLGLAHMNGKRARFPDGLKEQIKAELESGSKSVAQLSREYGPSHPTIMGWKREWGLTHPRPRKGVARVS